MPKLPPLSLRGRFLLYTLFGIVLPLALVGLWLTRASERSGVAMVRTRLAEGVAKSVDEFGRRWTRHLSLLTDLAETESIAAVLRGETGWPTPGRPQPEDLARRWRAVSEYVWLIEVRDLDGAPLARLPDDLGLSRALSSPPPGFLNYDLAIRERFSGQQLGTLAIQFRGDGLIPAGLLATGLSGMIVAVVDRRTGVALAPLPVDPELFRRDRFVWGDEEWVTAARDLTDPPVRFAIAAPLSTVTRPLASAAKQGTIALLVTVLLVFGLATLFTRRLTHSLEGLSRAARAVAEGDLDARAPESGPPSVRDTARAFNAMSAALRETLDRLSEREALAAVGEFAASLAHEVRNPLTSIRMDLERAERKFGADPREGTVLVRRALDGIDRLNGSVTNVLRVARSGQVRREAVDLRHAIEAAIRAAAPRLTARRGRCAWVPPEQPLWVRGDASALEELVLNLLLNAADAIDDAGLVEVIASEEQGQVTVMVRDDGPGLQESLHEQIFEPFYTTKKDGTGLGLAIARRIARAHGSELVVESAAGNGTCFRFQLASASSPQDRTVTAARKDRHEAKP